MELPRTLYELPRTLFGFHVVITKRARNRVGGSTLEERLDRLEAERDIRALIHQYAFCYDEGDLDGLMEIYSADCRLINNKGTFVGQDAIRANYTDNIADRSVGFHHVTDIQLALADDAQSGWAVGFLYNVAVRDGVSTGTMANCVFHVAVIDNDWHVTESRITISNRHRFESRDVPLIATSPPYATSSETVADLIDGFVL
jgi:ketosteroid isomerase-like protein